MMIYPIKIIMLYLNKYITFEVKIRITDKTSISNFCNKEELYMYNGIVLDKVQRNAFLSMSAQEGLICEKRNTDGVFGKVICYTPYLMLQK